MADNIEAKLNMSLDDLVKKDNKRHHKPLYQQRNTHQSARGNGNQQQSPAPGAHDGRPFHGQGGRAPYQQQPQQQWGGQQQQQWGGQQQQWGGSGGPQRRQMTQQQQQGAGGRSSVFARLGGPAQVEQQPMRGHYEQRGPPQRGQQQFPQQQAQQQQQQQPAAPPKPKVKVQCRLDAATGEVVISNNNVDIIKVCCSCALISHVSHGRTADQCSQHTSPVAWHVLHEACGY
jgi:hypothetical protein